MVLNLLNLSVKKVLMYCTHHKYKLRQILWLRILFESLAQLWKFGGQLPYVFLSCADQDFFLFSNRISLQLSPIFLISKTRLLRLLYLSVAICCQQMNNRKSIKKNSEEKKVTMGPRICDFFSINLDPQCSALFC